MPHIGYAPDLAGNAVFMTAALTRVSETRGEGRRRRTAAPIRGSANGQIMRNGQNKRMRGRSHGGHGHSHNNHGHSGGHRKSHNPMARVYESNGPDVKIRGNPSHIAEKYIQLARDAQASGDPISAENYYQHAEHYYRLIAAAQEQFRQSNPHLARTENEGPGGARDEALDEDDGDQQPLAGEAPFGTREPQPFLPRDAQPFPAPQQHQQQPQQQVHVQRPNQSVAHDNGGDIDRLPSFITGGQQPPAQQAQPGYQGVSQNGHENQGDRFPLHRRRRRHRGSRNDFQGGPRSDDRDDSPHSE